MSLNDPSPLHLFLRINVHITSTSLFLSQHHYVQKLLETYHMNSAKPVSMLIFFTLSFSHDTSPNLLLMSLPMGNYFAHCNISLRFIWISLMLLVNYLNLCIVTLNYIGKLWNIWCVISNLLFILVFPLHSIYSWFSRFLWCWMDWWSCWSGFDIWFFSVSWYNICFLVLKKAKIYCMLIHKCWVLTRCM